MTNIMIKKMIKIMNYLMTDYNDDSFYDSFDD